MATVKELREEAKRLGLKGYSKMNKAQLEEAVNNAQHQAQEQAHEDTPAVVEQNSTEQAQPQLQKISARDYLTLDEEQTISNANYSLLYNCDTKEEIIALLENTTKETMIYMIHHPDKRYTHFVAFHNNGNNLFEDHELDSWADSLKFTRKAVIVEDLASAIMRVKRSEAFHAKMQAAYELEQEALKWRPETPYEYERRMRYIHHLENMRTENPERYEKIRVKCVKDGIIRPDDLPSIHSINETPAVSEQPAVVQDEEEAITLLTIPENPCDRKHNQEYFDTSDNVRMLSTLKTAKAIRESLGTIGTRCTLDDILDWLHKEPDWNYNRGYTYATSDEVIDAITEILTGHPRVITINVPHITDIVPPRFPNYELLGNRIPMKYYDEIVEILSPYTTREELFSALMMSPEPICDALNMKFLGKCPLTTPKGEVFFSGPQGTLSEALKPQWCAVMADCIIEHRQQAQPAIVELEINPYSGYFCGYDAERRAFLNRVKNGHVPQSVLAELSPEEYAQVMQEVSDMEKKEQEQELAHAAQPSQPAVVEYDPEFVEECYIPDYQDCPAVLDDIPEPREQTTPIIAQSVPATPAVIEHQEQPVPVRKATHANPNFGTVRGMSTRELRAIAKRLDVDGYAKMDRLQLEEAASRKPRKFPRRAYDLGYCDNDKKLRRELSSLDPENVEIIARNLKGKTIELPTDSKLITKKFLIDAIVRAYFPQAQAKPTPKPKKQSNLDYVFEVGRQYFRGDRLEINYATAPIITILARKGNLLTIREEDTGFIYERRMKRHWRSIDYYEEVQIGNYDDCACSIPVDVIREKEFREITTAFQKTQRLLAYQAMFITRYMQPQPQPLALPAVVKHQEAPVQEVRHEAWKDHFCNHCNHAPTWTHAQFSTGILLSREYKKSSSKDSRRLWLTGRYNLAQLYTLAKALGLDIPKIELTSDYSKTDQKKLQIADIIWNEIISMEHVYTCTYEVNNPPALPAELVEPDPVHAAVPAIVPQPAPVAPAEFSASATPNPHTDTVRKPAGKYSSFSDELISACTTRAQLAELFSHAANKQVLLDTLHRLGFSSVGLKGISTKQKLAGYLAGKIFLLGGISNLTTTAKIELPKPQITAPAVKVIEGKHGQLMLDFDDTEDTGTPPSQPVAVKSKTRTTRKSRIKRDNSRQLAFVFDEVTDCKSNQRQAA